MAIGNLLVSWWWGLHQAGPDRPLVEATNMMDFSPTMKGQSSEHGARLPEPACPYHAPNRCSRSTDQPSVSTNTTSWQQITNRPASTEEVTIKQLTGGAVKLTTRPVSTEEVSGEQLTGGAVKLTTATDRPTSAEEVPGLAGGTVKLEMSEYFQLLLTGGAMCYSFFSL